MILFLFSIFYYSYFAYNNQIIKIYHQWKSNAIPSTRMDKKLFLSTPIHPRKTSFLFNYQTLCVSLRKVIELNLSILQTEYGILNFHKKVRMIRYSKSNPLSSTCNWSGFTPYSINSLKQRHWIWHQQDINLKDQNEAGWADKADKCKLQSVKHKFKCDGDWEYDERKRK